MLDLKPIKYYLINKCKQKKSGFSIIELLLAFTILVGLTTMFLKQINKKKKISPNDLVMQISEVTQKIFYTSIAENTVYALHLFFTANNVLTDIGYAPYNKKNSDYQITNKKKLKNPFYVKSFIINGKDEMAIKSKQIWLLFYPEGYCQETSLDIAEKENDPKIRYFINPLNGKIEDEI